MKKDSMRGGVTVTKELTAHFLDDLEADGIPAGSMKVYRQRIALLYEMLPEDRTLCHGTLDSWKEELLDRGYAERTVAGAVSVANSFLRWLERGDLQARPLKTAKEDVQPELTRSEYLRLLSAARALGAERSYLLVKVFGTTGIALRDLPMLTVEAIKKDRLIVAGWRCLQPVHIPRCLRDELLDYAYRAGILRGPVFVTGNGTSLARTTVSTLIKRLCREAQVAQEKGNPRCLRQMYKSTVEDLKANMSILVEQDHERLVEKEQLSVGWTADALDTVRQEQGEEK